MPFNIVHNHEQCSQCRQRNPIFINTEQVNNSYTCTCYFLDQTACTLAWGESYLFGFGEGQSRLSVEVVTENDHILIDLESMLDYHVK